MHETKTHSQAKRLLGYIYSMCICTLLSINYSSITTYKYHESPHWQPEKSSPSRPHTRPIKVTTAPNTNPSTSPAGTPTLTAALGALRSLVACHRSFSNSCAPPSPLLVANTLGSTNTTPCLRVVTVVANVWAAGPVGVTSFRACSLRKTSANEGALMGTRQDPFEHGMVTIVREFMRRPSEAKNVSPRV
jgi:hypothetical protein